MATKKSTINPLLSIKAKEKKLKRGYYIAESTHMLVHKLAFKFNTSPSHIIDILVKASAKQNQII